MQFEVCYLYDHDFELSDGEHQFIEAPSWLMALQIAEAKAMKKNWHLSELVRLE